MCFNEHTNLLGRSLWGIYWKLALQSIRKIALTLCQKAFLYLECRSQQIFPIHHTITSVWKVYIWICIYSVTQGLYLTPTIGFIRALCLNITMSFCYLNGLFSNYAYIWFFASIHVIIFLIFFSIPSNKFSLSKCEFSCHFGCATCELWYLHCIKTCTVLTVSPLEYYYVPKPAVLSL